MNAARSARVSLIGLGLLGVGGSLLVVLGIDRWLLHGVLAHGFSNVCQSVASGCQTAVFSAASVLRNPAQLVVIGSAAMLLFALAKGVAVLASARSVVNGYHLVEKLPVKLASAFRTIRRDAEERGGRQPSVRISESERLYAFTYGLMRPSICVSRGLIRALSRGELEAVLAHEYAHVRRRDNLIMFLSLLLRDFLYPLPITHALFGILVNEREHAADDLAAGLTEKPLELASALVTMSRMSSHSASPAYAAFSPAPSTVQSRVRRLLDRSPVARNAGRVMAALLASVLILTVLSGIAVAGPVSSDKHKSCHIGTCSETQVAAKTQCCER